MVIKKENEKWTRPQVAPFSGTYSDMDPSLSIDGQTLFFGSTRPTGNKSARGCDIWKVERMDHGKWSHPQNIGQPVNTLQNENYPSVTEQGTLYFHSGGHGGLGGLDIFKSEFRDGVYTKPKNLGTAINSMYNDFDAFIARDGMTLIFSSNGRPDGLGSGDLYISFLRRDGSWTRAQNMGRVINSASMDYCPKISPDGRYFFFTSERNGTGDIFWVDAKIIEQFRN